jgi:hypothetical protein
MKVKLFEIYNSIPVMNKILDAQLPVNISFQLTKLLKNLNEEIKVIEEQRVKLVSKHGEQSGDQGVTVPETKKEQFLKEFAELLDTEIEINWTPVSADKFSTLNLSANDLLKVPFLLSE